MANEDGNKTLTRGQMERLVEHASAQVTAEAQATTEKRKEPRTVNASRFREAEFLRHDWVVTAEFGTTIEEVRDEGYFAHVAARLSPYDEITVRVDDGIWMAKLVVLECGRNWARTAMLHFYKLTTTDIARTMSMPKVNIIWKGPHLKFCVIRASDNSIIAQELGTEDAARSWITSHEAKATS